MQTVPVPRDIPLPISTEPFFLEALLVVAFVAHILFVNLMLGGSLLVLGFELRGLRRPEFDKLAHAVANTVTISKSLAVVLGVAPLLLINVLYTIHFYTANALTGTAWILVVPLVAVAFLLLYLHKYSWERLAARKGLHLAILSSAVLIFLFVPLVFLTNVNLMMFPERWTTVHGFLSALVLPNVLPRYLHFLCASVILTSLFGAWYFGRAGFPVEQELEPLTRPALRRIFYSVAMGLSLAQFIVGPLLLFTLPAKGFHTAVVLIILLGAGIAIFPVWMLWQEVTTETPAGRRLPFILGYLAFTVICMAVGRHSYRFVALSEHRQTVQKATQDWLNDSAQAAYDRRTGRDRAAAGASDGEDLFRSTCGACHGVDQRVVGPPLTEIAQIYAGKAADIVRWARAPGKKRPDFPQMPPFASLGDSKLSQLADYMLRVGTEASKP